MLLANVENVDDLVIPQAWIDARKKNDKMVRVSYKT
jgi:hypothetical protein